MPCPCGGSKDPITLPSLSMWIIAGGRTQQSAIGGVSSASSSISVRSFGRSYTQTLSSLSTDNPVTPPIFHLFGRGLGQSGSNLYFGAVCTCAATPTHKTNKQSPANMAYARLRTLESLFMCPLLISCYLGFPRPTARSLVLEIGRVNKPTRQFDRRQIAVLEQQTFLRP